MKHSNCRIISIYLTENDFLFDLSKERNPCETESSIVWNKCLDNRWTDCINSTEFSPPSIKLSQILNTRNQRRRTLASSSKLLQDKINVFNLILSNILNLLWFQLWAPIDENAHELLLVIFFAQTWDKINVKVKARVLTRTCHKIIIN